MNLPRNLEYPKIYLNHDPIICFWINMDTLSNGKHLKTVLILGPMDVCFRWEKFRLNVKNVFVHALPHYQLWVSRSFHQNIN